MLMKSVEQTRSFFAGMKPWTTKALIAAGVGVLAAGVVAAASAQEYYADGIMPDYYKAAKGKTVAFVPIAMTFSITQEYLKEFQAQADQLGYKIVVRDPNWSVDKAVQAVEQLIVEKPDVIIAHPLDGMAFNRLVKKANDAGIYWIWANMKGSADGDAFVGANHYELDRVKVRLAADYCKNAASKKIFLIQTAPTNYTAIAGTQGVNDELKHHPELQLVGIQTGDNDANKVKSIAATVLKQHPDLCAFIGQWDGQDIGIAPAVAEAGLTGKVGIFTGGGGNKPEACDKVAEGAYTAYVNYNIETQGHDINAAVMQILQTHPKPGSQPFATYVENKVLTPENVKDFKCWSVSPPK
ncbi:MAG: sugar ABC transporter substrate-binding protein [Roseiarcus sp.]